MKEDSSSASTTSTAGILVEFAVGTQESTSTGTLGEAHRSCTIALSSALPADTARRISVTKKFHSSQTTSHVRFLFPSDS